MAGTGIRSFQSAEGKKLASKPILLGGTIFLGKSSSPKVSLSERKSAKNHTGFPKGETFTIETCEARIFEGGGVETFSVESFCPKVP